MTIPVYIIASGDPQSPYVAKLSALFDNGYFDIHVVAVDDDLKHHEKERKAFIYALCNAQQVAKNEPCIIVKDCTFSNLSNNDMYYLITNILENAKDWDVCYLARYLDKCNGKVVLDNITTGGSLVTTKSAEGDDAIMYTPKARDLILKLLEKKHQHKSVADIIHDQLVDGDIVGVAVSPPVLQYNPVFGDLFKTCECRHHDKKKDNDSNTSYSWIFFVLVFLILIILIVWFFFRR